MKAKDFIPATKPRNFVAKNQKTAGAGAHRDKKRDEKQGYEKHKGKGVSESSHTTKKQILTRIRQIMYDRKLSGTESNAGELLRLKQQLKDLRSQQGVAEATGDKPFDSMMKNIKKGTAKQATADRREARKQSQQRARDAFGPSPAANLGIRKPGVAEGSDFGEPREILEDVLQTLEREVEWPLTEVMDPREVRQLLAPIIRAVNSKLISMAEGMIPFDQCPECRGPIFHESMMAEKQDACYHKVRSRYKVWPSAYASGALVQCRKKGAANWGSKSK